LDQARVPTAERPFQTKWEIALALLDTVLAEDLPHAVIVADAGYGAASAFRAGLEARGERYLAGICGGEVVFATPPTWIPKQLAGTRGQPPRRAYLAADAPRPVAVHELAATLPRTTVSWRTGTTGQSTAEFAWVRVWPGPDWHKGVRTTAIPTADEAARWLLVEWRSDGTIKYALSNLPSDTPLVTAVRWWKERWQVEQGYRQLKRELGLDHFEGRSWTGFHHHVAMTFLAYGFLTLERLRAEALATAALGVPAEDDPLGEADGGG
jgi:SRSO17 transposase